MAKLNKETEFRPCCFCGLSQNNEFEFGKLYDLDDIVTHYYCLLLSSNMQQRGTDDQGILGFLLVDIKKEIRRGKRLVCIYCKKNGATLGCCNIKCKRIFHYPCGLRAGTLNQFFGEFRSYCISHRPKQKIDDQVKNELARTSETMCYICFEKVDPCDIVGTIWAPCCKKNAWFHRTCVQQLAISAGYFFKCPLCNDKKLFQKAMLEFGIFIPSQDASWELVPNAFQDLLYRYDQCDAQICLCPKGRKYTSFNAKWELTLCRTCGSQGIHMACGQLKWANPVWECSECISILGKSAEIPSSSSMRERLQNGSDSDDSDSDISVGKDSPVPFASTLNVISPTPQISIVKPRPGPRTFKLKQQQQARKEMQQHMKKQAKENVCLSFLNSTIKEHNLQSASNGQIITNASSGSLTEPNLHIDKNSANQSTEHSQSELLKSAPDIISCSSDDEVIEINDENSLNDTFIIFDNNTIETDNLFKTENNMIESNGTSNLNNLNSLQIETGEQQRTLNQTDSIPFLKSNSQKEVKSNVENTNSNHESVCRCIDSVSSIKIKNVVSLVPKEFGDSSSTKRKRKNIDSEFQNDIVEADPKRKLKNAPFTPIISHISESKILKAEDKQVGETSSSSNMHLYSFTPLTSNNNDLQIIATNERNTSISVSHASKRIQIHKPKRHVQITGQDISTNILPTSNVKISLKANTTNTPSENSERMHVTNEQNEIFENIKVDNKTKNCDGDAGTNFAVEPRNGSTKTDTRIKSSAKLVKSGHSRSEKSQSSEQWKFSNGIEMAIHKRRTSSTESNNSCYEQKYSNTECDYPRLIPEYIQLRDLKFRVHDLNNLQIILYDKFSVNINMEDANITMMNTNLDISAKKTIHQNTFNSQTEIPPNINSKNILESNWSLYDKDKSKCTFVSEQLENYKDDVKENVDPITTIPCKSVADSLPTNTTLIVDDSNVYTNNNNQYEIENLIRSVSTTIENDDERRSHESISLFRSSTSIFDSPINCRNKCVRKNHDAKKDEKDLKPNHIIHSTIEMQSTKIDFGKAPYDSTEFVRCTSFSEYHEIYKPEDRLVSQNKLDLKVSIDLKRIDDLIQNNSCVLSKYKKGKQ